MCYIKIIFDNKEIIIRLTDSEISKELWYNLPQELYFNDYTRNEKIAYINKIGNKCETNELYCPARGDIMFYAPWNYLTIFNNDHVVSNDYTLIGKIVSGLRYLNELKGFVKLEKAV